MNTDPRKLIYENEDHKIYAIPTDITDEPIQNKWMIVDEHDSPIRNREMALYHDSFSSIIPGVSCSCIVATVNKYIKDVDGEMSYYRGVIVIDLNDHSYYYVMPLSKDFDYIDGFDHNIARVNKNVDGGKKWGLVVLVQKDNKPYLCAAEVDKVGKISTSQIFSDDNKFVSENQCNYLIYNNLWNFYNKNRNHIPAEYGDIVIDISLDDVRKKIEKDYEFSMNNDGILNDSHDNDILSLSKVSLRNFKRYESDLSFNLSSQINFIVGKNNAGKSTLLQAIDLCASNLKQLHFDKGNLYFLLSDNIRSEYLDESLFEKFHSRQAKDKSLMLALNVGKWRFEFNLEGSELVSSLIVRSTTKTTTIEFRKESVTVVLDGINDGMSPFIFPCTNWNHSLNTDDGEKDSGTLSGMDVLLQILDVHTIPGYQDNSPVSLEICKRLKEICLSIDNAVSYCRSVKRISVFGSIGCYQYDDNGKDFVSKAVSKYAKIDGLDDSVYHQFVCKWLRKLEMGNEFEINSYKVRIVNKDGVANDLCNLGSGTIHFVALCFDLLAFIDDYRYSRYIPTLLLEEPEQNLHPMLQSHIANFLLDLSDFYSEISVPANKKVLRMLVETHSEYMIRRSQVLVKHLCKNGCLLENIPFKTFYFPADKEGKPYDMEYKESGAFQRDFGPGFVDESFVLSFQLL